MFITLDQDMLTRLKLPTWCLSILERSSVPVPAKDLAREIDTSADALSSAQNALTN